jgi:2-polyprenyl-3-methyl-5-hydroxy-6-metoxy-1,4-benzoquinol methylase
MLYGLRQQAVQSNKGIRLTSSRTGAYRRAAPMYFSRVKYADDSMILQGPKFISNAIEWGEHPDIFGPRDYFRNMLIFGELKQFHGVKKILDYGCGTGNMLTFLAQKGYVMTGMDISVPAIEYVKKRVASLSLSRSVTAFSGTFKTVRVPSGSFDAVWCGEVLEHTPDDKFEVENFYRVLKPGGRCFVSIPHSLTYWSDIDEYWGHYRRYSEAEIRALFKKCGFTVERTVIWGFPLTRLWDVLYNPVFRSTIKHPARKNTPPGIFSTLLQNRLLVELCSRVFYFDQLWNWTKSGKGIILVARKAKKKL